MAESIEIGLKAIVEQVVRPVVATRDRKRAMREELLTHLTAVFEDECANTKDVAAALDQTRVRFGDPCQLTAELQNSVSRRERLGGALQRANWGYWYPGEPVARTAMKQVALLLAFAVFVFVLVVVTDLAKRRHVDLGLALTVALADAVFSVPFGGVLLLLPTRAARLVFGRKDERSWPIVLAFSAAALATFPLMAFVVYWLATHDVTASLAHLLFACYFAPLAPLFFFVAGRMAFNEMRYEQEWASIEVDE